MNLLVLSAARRRVAALLFGLLIAGTASAAVDAKVTFNLPAGDAEQTLRQFSTQSGVQVIFPTQSVKGIATVAVRGELTAAEALDALLAGTPLVAVRDTQSGTVTVRRTTAPAAEKNGPSRPAEREAAGKAGQGIPDGIVRLDTFEVFGSKSINADLPRTRDSVQPYVVFDRAQLAGSQATTLDDFFRARLPMNQSLRSFAQVTVNTASSVNLRGLGTNQTLVLLDGRRLPDRAESGGARLQADINGIPLSMIERIEILPSTASGIHGGGATGGVINIITRKDYSGVEVSASYLNTFDTDAYTRRLELSASFQLEGGRTMLTLNGSTVDGTPLLTQDRDLVQRGRTLLLANNPAAFLGTAFPPLGYTTNIRSQTGANLVLKPQYGGTALGSPITFVPADYRGVAADGVAALVGNAGRYSLDLPDTMNGGRSNLRSVPRQESRGISLRRQFGPRVEAMVDASRFSNRGRSVVANLASTSTLAASAPNNPFTTAVNLSFPTPGFSRTNTSENISERLLAGAVVRLPSDWTAGLDYVRSRSKSNTVQFVNMLGDPDGTGPGISFATALATGALDVLRDVNRAPPDYGPYEMPAPFGRSSTRLETEEVTLRASGPLHDLPAGRVTLSISAQLRDEVAPESVLAIPSATNPVPRYSWSPRVSREARAYYAELLVPVFGRQPGAGWRRHLELQGSVRRDEIDALARADLTGLFLVSPEGPFPTVNYTTREWAATKATAGFKYAPAPNFALRASWGNGFLAPGLDQLGFNTGTTTNFLVVDPKRGNQQQVLTVANLIGGNPNIRPEESESVSAGVILTPRFAPGLRVSLDYTRITKTDEIGNIPNALLLAYEDRLPGVIVRAPLTAADQALGYTGGVIQQVDFRTTNIAGKRLVAYDLQLDYSRRSARLGEFQAYASATYQPDFSSQTLPDVPYLQGAGSAEVLKWRGNAGLTWSHGSWSLGWNMQYYHSYLVYTPGSSPATIDSLILGQGSATIPAQRYHDVLVTYRWEAQPAGWRSFLANTEFSVGVQNLLNTRPPAFATTAVSLFGYSPLGDPRLARYSLSLRKRF